MKKIVASTFTATIVLTLISVFNKGIAFFREVLYAKNFGLGDEFNAFLVSSVLPITIYSTIYYLSQFYFIPSYNKKISEDRNEEKKFLSDNLWIFFFLGSVVTALLFLFSDIIIDFYLSNVDTELKELSLKIFRVFIFTIPLSSAHSILAAYLNAEQKFIYPAVSIVLLNLTVVISLYTLVEPFGIFVIPYGFVFGMLLQLIFLLTKCSKQINFNPLPAFKNDSLLNVFNKTLLLTLLAEVITFSYMIVDRYFLDKLGEGGVASLSYSYQIYELPIKIFTFAIATIIFSKFSKSFYSLSSKELEKQFQMGIKLAIFIFTPMALIYFFGVIQL
jgi:putative peptidoglycan lipid II flippase